MKKITLSFFFLLIYFLSFTQSVNEALAREMFGDRFISGQEAGFENLLIPFTEEDLRHDHVSWLIPLEVDGLPRYELIQARYLPPKYEKYDTLSFTETVELLRVISKTKRIFPDNEKIKFFLTKERSFSADNQESYLTFVGNENGYSVIDLPKNSQIASINKKVLFIGDKVAFATKDESTELGRVRTLVRLLKD